MQRVDAALGRLGRQWPGLPVSRPGRVSRLDMAVLLQPLAGGRGSWPGTGQHRAFGVPGVHADPFGGAAAFGPVFPSCRAFGVQTGLRSRRGLGGVCRHSGDRRGRPGRQTTCFCAWGGVATGSSDRLRGASAWAACTARQSLPGRHRAPWRPWCWHACCTSSRWGCPARWALRSCRCCLWRPRRARLWEDCRAAPRRTRSLSKGTAFRAGSWPACSFGHRPSVLCGQRFAGLRTGRHAGPKPRGRKHFRCICRRACRPGGDGACWGRG